MINKKRLLCALWLSVFLSVPVAFAGNDRSWVASTGSDSNPCTRSQPCATFQGALAKTNAGGEIDVVDPGDYGTIQSFSSGGFTIDGGGMAHISVVGGDWAIVVLNASGPVIVRNLTVNGGGIWISGPVFNAENGTVSGVPSNFVGFSISSGTATLEHVAVYVAGNGAWGIWASNGAVVQVRNSVINNAGSIGILAASANVTVDTTLITSCGTGIQAGNTYNGSSGTILLSNSTITKNTTGLLTQSGGTIVSFVNNRIYGNTTNGSPTQSVFQK